MNTVSYYLKLIENFDQATYLHSIRVAAFACKIGRRIELRSKEQDQLLASALLHDIGKIQVPKRILHKPGKLSAGEWKEITNHPRYGVEMLRCGGPKISEEIVESVYCHHEFYNGTGYPRGIIKDDIPIYARIITIADAFDAMTTERPYRNHKLTLIEALDEIIAHAGTQFDPNIVNQLEDLSSNKRGDRTQWNNIN